MKNNTSYALGNMHGYLRVAEVGLNTILLFHDEMKAGHHSLFTDDELDNLRGTIDLLKEAQKRD